MGGFCLVGVEFGCVVDVEVGRESSLGVADLIFQRLRPRGAGWLRIIQHENAYLECLAQDLQMCRGDEIEPMPTYNCGIAFSSAITQSLTRLFVVSQLLHTILSGSAAGINMDKCTMRSSARSSSRSPEAYRSRKIGQACVRAAASWHYRRLLPNPLRCRSRASLAWPRQAQQARPQPGRVSAGAEPD